MQRSVVVNLYDTTLAILRRQAQGSALYNKPAWEQLQHTVVYVANDSSMAGSHAADSKSAASCGAQGATLLCGEPGA